MMVTAGLKYIYVSPSNTQLNSNCIKDVILYCTGKINTSKVCVTGSCYAPFKIRLKRYQTALAGHKIVKNSTFAIKLITQ